MQRTAIHQLADHVGQSVLIAGFVQVIRAQKNITFLHLRDVTGVVQVVVLQGAQQATKAASKLSLESVVAVTGQVKAEKQAPGGFEVAAETMELLSLSEPELPIPVVEKAQDETDPSIRLDWRWIDLRKPKNTLMMKVWTAMEQAFREYWIDNGYMEIHSPKLIATASESGAQVFEVKYFDRKAYLAQSPQFYKQMAMAAGFEKVFEVGPVFRAEPSFTSRHATEFIGFDTELSYIASHEDVMAEEERTIAFVLTKLKEQYGDAVKEAFGREIVVPKVPFPRIPMSEAKKILASQSVTSEREGDLNPEEEKALSRHILKEFDHAFVFVTDYPVSVRPFYHMRHEDDPSLTKSFDLLWGGLEVTTGAQREHRYDILVAQAKEVGMSVTTLQFYLDFFRYGCPPHGGYGMGPNRMIMSLLGLDNLRDAMFLFRGVKRLKP